MMIRQFKISTLLFILMHMMILTGCGSDNKKNEPIDDAPNYQAIIDNAISSDLPGVILHINAPKAVIDMTAGVTNIQTGDALQVDSKMPTGSAGKPFIALLAILAHHEGLLDINAPISTWIEESALSQIEFGQQMTLLQLLNHTSGIFNYVDNPQFFADVLQSPEISRGDADLLQYALNQPSYFTPGQGFEYSNTGYTLAGIILDDIYAAHHSSILRSKIIEPLGLNDTFYKGIEKHFGDFISGYIHLDDDLQLDDIKPYQVNIQRANAPLVSTPRDLAHFLKSLIEDNNFVSEEAQAMMFGEDQLITAEGANYGLGLITQNVHGQKAYFHNGLEPGYTTYNIYFPDSKISLAMTINCGGEDACAQQSQNLFERVLYEVTR